MKKTIIPFLFIFLISFYPQKIFTFTLPKLNPTNINEFLKKMPLKSKIGQMFIFGFSGTNVNYELKSIIEKYHPGAVIVYEKNISSMKQIAQLNYESQKISIKTSKIPLLIAIDQEGGIVSRIKTDPPLPSALAVGQTNSIEIAKSVGKITGKILSSLGFNMNLAPVLDLSNPMKDTFIGTRSYGNNPETVLKIADAYSLGLISQNIIPTAKHFPGHGGEVGDSHKILPKKEKNLKQLMQKEVFPFKNFLKNNNKKAIMIAHLAFPSIDNTKIPATFSSKIIHDFLRKKLNYEGIIVTDDIEMGGLKNLGSIGTRAIKAIQAGSDLIMVAWSNSAKQKAFNAVLQAVKKGIISEKRINESLERILTTKSVFLHQKINKPNLAEIKDIFKQKNYSYISDKILKIIFFNELKKYPKKKITTWLKTYHNNLIILSPNSNFSQEIKKITKNSSIRFFHFNRYSKTKKIIKLIKKNPDSPICIYITSKKIASIVTKLPLKLKENLILINSSTPGIISKQDDYAMVFNLSFHHPESGKMLIENLFPQEVKKNNYVYK